MSNFPKQYIPDSDKTEEWCEKNIDAIVIAEASHANELVKFIRLNIKNTSIFLIVSIFIKLQK